MTDSQIVARFALLRQQDHPQHTRKAPAPEVPGSTRKYPEGPYSPRPFLKYPEGRFLAQQQLPAVGHGRLPHEGMGCDSVNIAEVAVEGRGDVE